jgi:MFS family permease
MAEAIPSFKAHIWSHFFAVKLKPELKELYWFSLIFSFASALITIFEPVFFYQQGFSLSFIALYYALHYTIYTVALPWGGKFAARFGLERSLSLSLPLFIAYFITLALIPQYPDLIWLAIVLLTVHKIFYWPAFHTTFAKFGDRHNRGTELSWMRVLQYGIGILGPLFGGIIAATLGFPVLFIIAAFLTLSSAVPLLMTKERFKPVSFSYAEPWRIIISRRYRNMSLAMMGMGENLIDLVYWPIFLFIILGATDTLGIVASINIMVMTGLSFVIGEMSDKYPRRHVLRMYLPFMVIGYLFRPLAVTPFQAFLTDTLNRMSFAGV